VSVYRCVSVSLLVVAWQRWSQQREGGLVCLHGLQVLLAYLLMLAAMTYSSELLSMVVLGLTAGYALFNLSALPPASAEPCCMDQSDASSSSSGGSEYELHRGGGGLAMTSAGTSGRGGVGEYQKII
jgi:hypothetical protein